MKKLSILAMCLIMVFCMTGCVNDEVTVLFERSDAAEDKYSSFDVENTTYWYVEDGSVQFQQETGVSTMQLVHSSDRVSHGTLVTNRGSDIEESTEYYNYTKGDYSYFDMKGMGRYWQKTVQSDIYDIIYEHIEELDASDFKSVKITDLTDGGKKLYFRLNPSAIPEEAASEFIMNQLNFMPKDFEAEHARLLSYEYTVVLDKDFLKRSINEKATVLLELKNGATARATSEDTYKMTRYYSIAGDHLVFPDDLGEYVDLETYLAG